ncbi:hypothetical protein SteCoe_11097 [Stentor coeruleus]|uniref:Uncharacterized protein n=1 Tax=Stentor coeruleus TaxID=5963 RepID=A0A1R2CE10_9CILI|nr:hypothetical protein SteCoe_11097 [Stentor coeruleus]
MNHFRGESFGAPIIAESVEDNYLETLIAHYKSCLILEKSGKNPEALLQHVRSIEREISLLDNWNSQLEELLEIKDLEIDRLNEDIRDLDEDLKEIDCTRQELESRCEHLQQQKAIKDKIIQKQEFMIKSKEPVQNFGRNITPVKSEKRLMPKTARNRYESPTLV